MTLEEEIEEGLRFYAEAKARGEVEALVNCFSEDAILLFPSEPPVIGRSAIRVYYTEHYSTGVEEKLDLIHVESKGNIRLICGRWEESGEMGKFLTVEVREADGSWLAKRMCVQSD